VQDDEDRRPDVARKVRDDAADRLDSAGRGADNDDVVLGHSDEPARRGSLQKS